MDPKATAFTPGVSSTTMWNPNASTFVPKLADQDIVNQYQQCLADARDLAASIARDYRVLGEQYHSLPFNIRYHHSAKPYGIIFKASNNFVVSSQNGIPEMIIRLREFEYLIDTLNCLLQDEDEDEVMDVEIEDIQLAFTLLDRLFTYTSTLLGKLESIMKIFADVVTPNRDAELAQTRAMRGGGGKVDRMRTMVDRWSNALPAVCFAGYPGAGEDKEEAA